jgi:hypothetical protein
MECLSLNFHFCKESTSGCRIPMPVVHYTILEEPRLEFSRDIIVPSKLLAEALRYHQGSHVRVDLVHLSPKPTASRQQSWPGYG